MTGSAPAAGRHRQEFYGHGYCATNTYIRTVAAAHRLKNPDGPFHPTDVGHQKAELHNFPALCQVLYKNNDCTSD